MATVDNEVIAFDSITEREDHLIATIVGVSLCFILIVILPVAFPGAVSLIQPPERLRDILFGQTPASVGNDIFEKLSKGVTKRSDTSSELLRSLKIEFGVNAGTLAIELMDWMAKLRGMCATFSYLTDFLHYLFSLITHFILTSF